MVLNYIWISFFIVAFLVALLKTFMGDLEIFSLVVNSIFERAELGFKLSLGLTGIMALWLGIMRIGEKEVPLIFYQKYLLLFLIGYFLKYQVLQMLMVP